MKDPMRLVDRFLYKHPNFGIPGLARYLAVGTGAAWVIGLINSVLYAYLSFSAAAVLHGQVWRLVSALSRSCSITGSAVRSSSTGAAASSRCTCSLTCC